MRRQVSRASIPAILVLSAVAVLAQGQPQVFDVWQGPEAERFLHEAEFARGGRTLRGVAMPRQVVLELDGIRRYAVFKDIDEKRSGATPLARGGVEIDFQDSWRTEIPAYRLDKLLELGMVPATIERVRDGRVGSLQAFVASAMSEATRVRDKVAVPDPAAWNNQIYKVRMFDNLIYNTDRHLNNILVTKDWKVILIDHSRAFRRFKQLKDEENLTRFSRSLLDAMRRLDKDLLIKHLDRHLDIYQIEGILARRDLIVERAQRMAAERGEAAVYVP